MSDINIPGARLRETDRPSPNSRLSYVGAVNEWVRLRKRGERINIDANVLSIRLDPVHAKLSERSRQVFTGDAKPGREGRLSNLNAKFRGSPKRLAFGEKPVRQPFGCAPHALVLEFLHDVTVADREFNARGHAERMVFRDRCANRGRGNGQDSGAEQDASRRKLQLIQPNRRDDER